MRRVMAFAWLVLTAFAAPAAACDAPATACPVAGAWGMGEYRLALAEGRAGPAVIFLHGWGGRADATIANAGLVEGLRARGFAVIAPQGMPRAPGDTGGAWNAVAASDRRDDVAFLRAVADDAAARAGLNRGRMLLAGFSGGGMMAWRVACDAPDSFSGYAPIAGLLWRPLPMACTGPVRLLHVHGWADEVVPIEGRAVAGGRIVQGDLFAGLALLRAANGCRSDAPDAYRAEGPFLIRRWRGCAPGAALDFALFPGGHRVPEGWAALALGWFEAFGG